ncbi:PPOX class F420-dependent oxidoreductase [Solihabitans fulvus]|uniref:PPOX class F420-dependent oxidoreductase n=1 Tax=Solihabitans fulvus TaxID=1892852 RepID=A0A5B2X691_9PSEU|nr:PPOX class F420-dependent oxidoreductase [Solihabitans fulvus]KAA2258726.1 PPOX class F420-dependent oxidoreductase [Solihabitans fulvus]
MSSEDRAVARLAEGKYVLLTTFRKDGRAVPTPVWVAGRGEELVVWTPADSGKAKRVRRGGAAGVPAEVGPCDVRGNPTGDSAPCHAVLLDDEGSDQVRALIARKYGIVGRLVLLGSRLRRGRTGTVGIAITLTDQSSTQG